ncbi:MAG TPA: cyclic nucleotide-binding domain-containing protein [Deltaproteobacteria bacterium]|nr:cyclic nucleotide-binding domain-containing protein [Deltaproteobacteria bacterium]HOI05856.1 cyclic nucleotide-binding domain-containing protein [Deltaproteobacteria bacterium]
MKKPGQKTGNPKDILKAASRKAAQGDTEKALELYEACMREYLRKGFPLRALAAAKAARTAFGKHPKAQGMLIRLLSSMGLSGDAAHEFSRSSEAWLKDDVDIFRDLSMDEFTGLLEIMQIERVRKGRFVVRQNDPGSDVFIVIRGSLEVVRDGELMAFMLPGDVFGELGFFSGKGRSAGVRAAEPCELVRIPAKPLKELCMRYPNIRRSLDELYSSRIVKKAGEDLRHQPLVDLHNDILATVLIPKGEPIPFDSTTDVTIIKHGVVEVTLVKRGLNEKRFLKPGSVIGRIEGTARASTDVELIRASIDIVGVGRKAKGF